MLSLLQLHFGEDVSFSFGANEIMDMLTRTNVLKKTKKIAVRVYVLCTDFR